MGAEMGADMEASPAIPVGLNLTAIGVSGTWWRETAQRAERAGFGAVWVWDHFISRGRLDDPLLECWTTLTAAAVSTERIRVGSFVANNLNRHPAVLANIVGTLAELAPGRVELGIGIGGHPAEHAAYGMDFPPAAERTARLAEAVEVIRALFDGGPVDYEGRYYRLERAYAAPRPSPPPRIVVAASSPVGVRLAARLGDAWTCMAADYAQARPVFDTALATAGRAPHEVGVLVTLEPEDVGEPLAEIAARWQAAGATELVIHDVGPADLEALFERL
jgi:alkanesulfonate monooxygenase SsuD/methylene tetrahydromethanopterin reductase-like flavin-dependent oxidoreductase (luciferase family)